MKTIEFNVGAVCTDCTNEAEVDAWLSAVKAHLMEYLNGIPSMNITAQIKLTGEI